MYIKIYHIYIYHIIYIYIYTPDVSKCSFSENCKNVFLNMIICTEMTLNLIKALRIAVYNKKTHQTHKIRFLKI